MEHPAPTAPEAPKAKTSRSSTNPNRKNFRFRANAVHLTYKGHIDFEHELFKKWREDTLWFSIVHENSDPENPYEHTHAAFKWKKSKDSANPRYFDIDGIHPNIQPVKTHDHEVNIWEYHGKEGSVARIKSDQGPGDYVTHIDRIRKAETLAEACTIAGVEIKSVSDVLHIRNDVPRDPKRVKRFGREHFILQVPDDWRCLFIYGPTNTGKTQWAIAQFHNPLIISELDDLRSFDPATHDGIVFDDVNLSKFDRNMCIFITDWDEARQIKCRYRNARIPAHTRKIFTSNFSFETTFPPDEAGAIRRRISRIIHVDGPTFNERIADQNSNPDRGTGEPSLPGVPTSEANDPWESAIGGGTTYVLPAYGPEQQNQEIDLFSDEFFAGLGMTNEDIDNLFN